MTSFEIILISLFFFVLSFIYLFVVEQTSEGRHVKTELILKLIVWTLFQQLEGTMAMEVSLLNAYICFHMQLYSQFKLMVSYLNKIIRLSLKWTEFYIKVD